MEFMKMIGPSIELCGIPDVTGESGDETSSTTTLCCLPVR